MTSKYFESYIRNQLQKWEEEEEEENFQQHLISTFLWKCRYRNMEVYILHFYILSHMCTFYMEDIIPNGNSLRTTILKHYLVRVSVWWLNSSNNFCNILRIQRIYILKLRQIWYSNFFRVSIACTFDWTDKVTNSISTVEYSCFDLRNTSFWFPWRIRFLITWWKQLL